MYLEQRTFYEMRLEQIQMNPNYSYKGKNRVKWVNIKNEIAASLCSSQ